MNQADSLIFQTEKQLKEYGDKISADKKAPIESALNKLKEAHKSQNLPAIDAAMAEMNTAWTAASEEIYKAQAGAQPGADAATAIAGLRLAPQICLRRTKGLIMNPVPMAGREVLWPPRRKT